MKKGVLYTSIVAITIAMIGCSKYKVASFVMPTWDTQFSAPIFNRTYTLWEILSKDSVQVTNGDTTFLLAQPPNYVFTLFRTQSLNVDSVGTNLEIGSVPSTTANQSPSDFQISSPPPANYSLVNPGLPVGVTGPVPAIPLRSDTLDPDSPFNNFKSVTFASGTITITLHNGYPTPITFASPGLVLTDASNNPIFDIPVSPNPVVAGQTVVLTHSLDGYTLPNNPRVLFKYSADSATSATFQSDTILAMSFSPSNIRASEAVAVIPKQAPYSIDSSIVLTDGNKVSTADIKSGTLTLTINNGFPVADTIDLVLESLVSQTNPYDTLSRRIVLQPLQSNYVLPIDLAGYRLVMSDQFGPSDSVRYRVVATSPGSQALPDSFVTVSTSQSIQSNFDLTDLQLSSFTGEVHLKNPINIPSYTQSVNLGDFAKKFNGQLTFGPNTQLELNVNGIGFPSVVHITMIPGSSNSPLPPVASAVVNDSVVVYPGPNKLILGPSFVTALNNFTKARNTIPDQFTISGSVTINPSPYTTTGTVTDTSRVTGTGTISMPFDIGIVNATYQDTTKDAVIPDSATAAKMANVDSGRVVIEMWNGLPLQIAMLGQLIDTTTHQVVMNFPSDTIKVAPATVNSDGSVRDSVFSRNVISLTNAQARILGQCYMRFSFSVSTPTNLSTVPFQKDDDLSLRVFGNFAFRVDSTLAGK